MITSNIDKYFESIATKISKGKHPGFAYTIIIDNKITSNNCYGFSNQEDSAPITNNSLFYLASLSKQFTATCTHIILEKKGISKHQDIREILPSVQHFKKKISILNLLNHTSGIPDYLQYLACQPHLHDNDYLDNDDILQIIQKLHLLNFEPGYKFQYSNSNYILLVQLIEKLSGLKMNKFSKKYIFDKLDMKSTFYDDDRNKVVLNRVHSYKKFNKQYKLYLKNDYTIGDGGVLSNIDDLIKWEHNYYHNQLEPKNLIHKLTQKSKLSSGKYNIYGSGLFFKSCKNYDYNFHSGSWEGFKNMLLRIPSIKFSLIFLSNCKDLEIDLSPDSIINRLK